MRREPHVRFREGAGVKFPRDTPLLITKLMSATAVVELLGYVSTIARFGKMVA